MTEELDPDDLLRMEIPAFDASLIEEYSRVVWKMVGEWREPSRKDPAMERVRREHGNQVQLLLEQLTEENAHASRVRLREVHAALESAEKEIRAQRAPEELREEELLRVRFLGRSKDLRYLVHRAWKQANERDPSLVDEWRQICVSRFLAEDEFLIGSLMLTQAYVRRVDARARPESDRRKGVE